MSTDEGATVVPEAEGDPCITRDEKGKEYKGKHKFEWTNEKGPDDSRTYFTGKRCKNCGEQRPA